MEDSVRTQTIDTAVASDGFEIVTGQTYPPSPPSSAIGLPELKIAGDGSLEGLWECLEEMLKEDIDTSGNPTKEVAIQNKDTSGNPTNEGSKLNKVITGNPTKEVAIKNKDTSGFPTKEVSLTNKDTSGNPIKEVAIQNKDTSGNPTKEVVIPHQDTISSPKEIDLTPRDEKMTKGSADIDSPDKMDNEDYNKNDACFSDVIEELGDVQQDCTIFNGVSFLGSAQINAPKSDTEIQRNMVILNRGSVESIKVSISIPSCSDGSVVLYDALTNSVIQKFEICRIVFYAHGKPNSNESACFAFTWTHGGETLESSVFQCQAFRCDIPEAVSQVSACFMKAFQRVPRSLTASMNGELSTESDLPTALSNIQLFVLELTMEIKEDDGKGNFSTVPRVGNIFKIRSNVEKQVCLTITQVTAEGQRKLEIKRCFGILIAPGRNVKHSAMQLLDMGSTGTEKSEESSYVMTGQWGPRETAFEALNIEADGRGSARHLTVAVDLVVRGISEPVRLLVETQVRVYPENERFWYFSRRVLLQPFTLNLKEIPSLDTEPCFEVTSIESPGEVDRSRLNITLNNLANYIRSPSISSMEALTPQDDNNSDGDEPLLSGTGNVSKECSLVEMEAWNEVLSKWTPQNSGRPRNLGALVRLGIPEALRGEVWQRLANSDSDAHLMDKYRILITMECDCESVIQRDINRTFPAHEYFRDGGGGGGQDALFRISKAYAVHDKEVGYCQGLSFLAATLLLHMPEEQAFCVLLKIMYDYGLRELYKDGFECLRLRLYQLNRLMEEQLPQLYGHFRERGVESHMFASQWFLTLFTARFPLYFVFHIIDVFLLQGTDTLFQVALAILTTWKKVLLGLDFEAILKYFRVTLPKRCRKQEVARNIMKLACSIKVKKLKKYEQEFLELKEAEENAEECNSEIERLKCELSRSEEDKKRLMEQLVQVKELLKKEVTRSEGENKRNTSIIDGYKAVCVRLDRELQVANNSINNFVSMAGGCEKCSKLDLKAGSGGGGANGSPTASSGLADPESQLLQRVSELELELAQAKLAQVEAECRNQDLSHKLGATLSEMQAARNSWPPWLSKTLSSIREAAVAKGSLQRAHSDSGEI